MFISLCKLNQNLIQYDCGFDKSFGNWISKSPDFLEDTANYEYVPDHEFFSSGCFSNRTGSEEFCSKVVDSVWFFLTIELCLLSFMSFTNIFILFWKDLLCGGLGCCWRCRQRLWLLVLVTVHYQAPHHKLQNLK